MTIPRGSTSDTASVVVVGSINRDIVVRVAAHPTPGETVLGNDAAVFPGGKGANQAVAAVRLKAPAHRIRMIGRIGRDGFGAEMRAFLDAEGIDTTDISQSRASTGLAMITVDHAGQNMITVASGANLEWGSGLPDLQLAPRDVVVCQLEVPLNIVEATFTAARHAMATTILNPAPFETLPPALLGHVDVLVLNEIELAQMLAKGSNGRPAGRTVQDITDGSLLARVRALLDAASAPRAIVVTLGAAGALLVEAGGRALRVPGHAVRAIDTTGAGDCFVGALAARLLDDHDLPAAVTFANAAAAVSVTRAGAATSMPRRQDVPG